MKHWKLILLVIWMIAITLFLVFYIIPQEERLQNDNIERLEQQKKSLIIQNSVLDEEIVLLKKQADSLTKRIVSSNTAIIKLKNELNEKMDNINAMSIVDLHQYFTKFRTDSLQFSK